MALLNHILVNYFKYRRKLTKTINFSIRQQRNFNLSTQCKTKTPRILFFGTDNFSLPSLKALYTKKRESVHGAVTSFKNPANSVRLYAEEHQLPLYRWPISEDIRGKYDLGVVVSFGHMIPSSIIKALPLGVINVHASLLPRWRGAAPIIYSLLNEDTETGVSVMKIEPKHFDIGDILAQRKVPIKENCFMPDLHEELAHQGAELLLEVINDYKSKLKNAKKQNEDLATYAPKVTAALTEIVWSALDANEIYKRYRALYGFKHLTTRFNGKIVQLLRIKLPQNNDIGRKVLGSDKSPGFFKYLREQKCLLVSCASGSFLEIHELRVEGRKVMTAMDFNNGFLKNLKTIETNFIVNENANC